MDDEVHTFVLQFKTNNIMDTRSLQQVVSDIAMAEPTCTHGMIALAASLEVEISNFYLYEQCLKRDGGYDAGYCEGKRDAFLQVLHFLDGSDDISERIAELNEILANERENLAQVPLSPC
jgi:hypothetical protein